MIAVLAYIKRKELRWKELNAGLCCLGVTYVDTSTPGDGDVIVICVKYVVVGSIPTACPSLEPKTVAATYVAHLCC